MIYCKQSYKYYETNSENDPFCIKIKLQKLLTNYSYIRDMKLAQVHTEQP